MTQKIKLLIVDDEYLVRLGLRATIDWESLGIQIAGECANGKDALEFVRNNKIDLIISDVRMPVMDGIELAQKLAEDQFDGAVIFYSGYSDFEYARKALEYGVSGYVLKPVKNEQLTECVSKTLARLEEKRKNKNTLSGLASGAPYLKEMYFDRLLGGSDDVSLKSQLELLDVILPTGGGGLISYAKRLHSEEPLGALYRELSRALENFGAEGYLWDDEFVIVTGLKDCDALRSCAERLIGEIYGGTGGVFLGIAAFGGGLTLAEAAVQAKNLASSPILVGGVYVKDPAGGEVKRLKKMIEDALALIGEHYAEKITVKWVAGKLFVSESHLMHELKEELGVTFNDCLKQVRIAKAKELLAEGKMRINEVAAAVGFSDTRYFGQIFKEMTGKTPGEYMGTKDEK